MQRKKAMFTLVGILGTVTLGGHAMCGQEKAAAKPVQTHVVITDMALRDDADVPRLKREDVKLKQGKTFLQVTQLIPAEDENAALQLMILIDDTLDQSIGNNLTELKNFVNAQAPTTVIAVGYMSSAGVNVVQNFTADHDLVTKAIRLPRGQLSTMDSPYLSLISLVKNWKQLNVRREVVMLTDGIDRLRGEKPQVDLMGPTFGPTYHSMPMISTDATAASENSQRFNVVVYPFYSAGVGRAGRSSWDLQLGLSGLTKIADETGGECFSLGTRNLVSYQPYLERLEKYFANQYYLVFLAAPKKNAGFQRINVQTEIPNSELAAPDNVWVVAAK